MNKIEKQVLNYFISQNQGCDYTLYAHEIETLGKYLGLSYRDVSAVIKHLSDKGHLETKVFDNGNICFTRLTYKGLNYKDFGRKDLFKYLAEKWIDILALAISCIALIISIMK